jgi:hypothetical protein
VARAIAGVQVEPRVRVRRLAGRAAVRLLPALGMDVGRDTALRVRGIPLPDVGVPRVLGIDDFALRRGQATRPC